MIKLRELEYKDRAGMLEWMDNPNITQYFQYDFSESTMESVTRFINIAQIEKSLFRHYAIVDELDDEYLGTVSLKKIDKVNLNAEYAIVCREIAHGKGIAKEATRNILKIAFEELELHKVYLNVLSENICAIKLYEKCGFKFEGEFREHIFKSGNYKNLKWYSIKEDEFISSMSN